MTVQEIRGSNMADSTKEGKAKVEVTPEEKDVEMKETTTELNKGAIAATEDEVDVKERDEASASNEKEVTATAFEEEEKMVQESREEEEKEEEAPKRKRKEKTPVAPAEAPSRSSKRSRKQVKEFKPDNFMAEKDMVNIIEGRGMKCEDIPNVREKIESYSNNSEEIIAAHKLVFRSNIGKPASNHRKEHLLAFSGYLPALVEGEDKKEQEKSDEKFEVRLVVSSVCIYSSSPGDSHYSLCIDENGAKGLQACCAGTQNDLRCL